MFDLGNKKIWQEKLSREKDTNQPPKTVKNNRNLLSKN